MRYLGITILALTFLAALISCESEEESADYGFNNIIIKTAVSHYVIGVGSERDRGTTITVEGYDEYDDDSFDGDYYHYLHIDGEDYSDYLTYCELIYAEFVLPNELVSGQNYAISYCYQQVEDDIIIVNDIVSGDITVAYYPTWTKPDSLTSSNEEVTFSWDLDNNNMMQAAYAISQCYNVEDETYDDDVFLEDISPSDRSYTFPVGCVDDFESIDTGYAYFIYSMNYTNHDYIIFMSVALCDKYSDNVYDRDARRMLYEKMAQNIHDTI